MKPGGTLAPHLTVSNPGSTDTELPLSSSYRASASWTGPRSSRSTNCCWIWLAIFVCQRGTGRTISRTTGELIWLLAMILLSPGIACSSSGRCRHFPTVLPYLSFAQEERENQSPRSRDAPWTLGVLADANGSVSSRRCSPPCSDLTRRVCHDTDSGTHRTASTIHKFLTVDTVRVERDVALPAF